MAFPTADELMLRLSPTLRRVLHRVTCVASEHDITLWLVGGGVRDVLLGVPLDRDIDLAVEGDALNLAHVLVAALGGQLVATHDAFGTATVMLDTEAADSQPLTLDLAQTRSETYAHPGALPTVQFADVVQDLARRDFSLNAMALALVADERGLQFGRLLDPFGGRADLAAHKLKVLHPQSFRDDPTRMLRGVRVAARFSLVLEPGTERLLDQALAANAFTTLSPERIRNELCLALEEPQPATVLRYADAWGITPHLFAVLRWNERLAARCGRATRQADAPFDVEPLVVAGLLTYDLGDDARRILGQRYRLPNDVAKLLHDIGPAKAAVVQLTADQQPSAVDALLRPFSAQTLVVTHYAEPEPQSTIVAHYLTHLRPVTPLLDGHALQGLGVAPGPQLGQLLRELRAARLDGLVQTRADEERWVRERVWGADDRSAM